MFYKDNSYSKPAVTVELKKSKSFASDAGIQIVPSNYQHIGNRGNQEDAFAFSDLNNRKAIETNGFVAVVADGMGGLQYGEEASRVAVAFFMAEYERIAGSEPVNDRLYRAISVANSSVYNLACSKGGTALDLGTTLAAAVVLNNSLYWVSIGDSRIYLFRDLRLKQLTIDHVYANYLQVEVDNGKIPQEEADRNPERNYLTSYLGLPKIAEFCYSEDPVLLDHSDRVILCSDGLYDTLSNEAMIEVLKSSSSSSLAEELIEAAIALNNPIQDNVTVATLSVL